MMVTTSQKTAAGRQRSNKRITKELEPITFLFEEILVCGAVLSGFELCQAMNRIGRKCYIGTKYNNEKLEKYFKIKPIDSVVGTSITFTPKRFGDYAYVRTKDGRWLMHYEPKIAVSKWIADWIGTDTVIGNGTHERFKRLNIERDIDVLIEGNYEANKNIERTVEEAKKLGGRIVWFGRKTVPTEGVETLTSPEIEEIPKLYNRAKTFLKMSKEEGWGRPVAEAMACGCEVINKSGGNKEIEIVSWEYIAHQLNEYLCRN